MILGFPNEPWAIVEEEEKKGQEEDEEEEEEEVTYFIRVSIKRGMKNIFPVCWLNNAAFSRGRFYANLIPASKTEKRGTFSTIYFARGN